MRCISTSKRGAGKIIKVAGKWVMVIDQVAAIGKTFHSQWNDLTGTDESKWVDAQTRITFTSIGGFMVEGVTDLIDWGAETAGWKPQITKKYETFVNWNIKYNPIILPFKGLAWTMSKAYGLGVKYHPAFWVARKLLSSENSTEKRQFNDITVSVQEERKAYLQSKQAILQPKITKKIPASIKNMEALFQTDSEIILIHDLPEATASETKLNELKTFLKANGIQELKIKNLGNLGDINILYLQTQIKKLRPKPGVSYTVLFTQEAGIPIVKLSLKQ